MRAEFQILVIPYIRGNDGETKYVIFKRKDYESWQFIAGGGEDGERPFDAAKRETEEEAGINSGIFYKLKTTSMIPICEFADHKDKKGLYVIPEHCFAVELTSIKVSISDEHSDFRLVSYGDAMRLLRYDGNKTALWELNERIKEDDLEPEEDTKRGRRAFQKNNKRYIPSTCSQTSSRKGLMT